jgi:photosynthetic reaction center cytochrome c subunit
MRPFRRSIPVTLALAIMPAGVLAQPPRPPRPPENVKVLTELDPTALRAEMQRIAAALGVKCDHCHVQGNFASDERSAKRIARRMIEMTSTINAQHFPKYEVQEGGSVLGRVTCYTCHQGSTEPRNAPQ